MGILVAIIVIAVVLTIFGFFSHVNWRGRLSQPERFAKERPASTSLRTQLRRDVNARITLDSFRFLWISDARYWFQGTGCPPQVISVSQYQRLHEEQAQAPVLLACSGDRQYWWWNNEFYWDNGQYISQDVRVVVLKQQRQNRTQVEQARTLVALEEDPNKRRREGIPEEVRRFVFQRDGGECQQCGSRELLQFDHVIPVALGGSNEPENLQLLCATCNREKSDHL